MSCRVTSIQNSDVKGILDDIKVEVSGKRQADSLEGLESNLN